MYLLRKVVTRQFFIACQLFLVSFMLYDSRGSDLHAFQSPQYFCNKFLYKKCCENTVLHLVGWFCCFLQWIHHVGWVSETVVVEPGAMAPTLKSNHYPTFCNQNFKFSSSESTKTHHLETEELQIQHRI